jgi:hypothetical protein
VNGQLKTNKQSRKNVYEHVVLAVIPHRENDYQPHLIRRYGLLIVLLLIVAVQLVYNVNRSGSVLGDTANVSIEALLDEANKARRKDGLSDLSLSQKLNQAAYLKATDMFEKQYWGHNAPDGTKPWKWFIEVDYGYTKAGENLAKNFYTAEAVTTAWMDSVEHRKNILEPDYTEVGFAVASGMLDGQQTTIVVALYGRPVGTGVVSPGKLVAGAQGGSLNLVTRLGIGMQSMTPAALGSIVLLTFLMMVAFMAHLYRDYIPASAYHPRHRHNHGAIKMSLMFVLILAMLVLYGGGQL